MWELSPWPRQKDSSLYVLLCCVHSLCTIVYTGVGGEYILQSGRTLGKYAPYLEVFSHSCNTVHLSIRLVLSVVLESVLTLFDH